MLRLLSSPSYDNYRSNHSNDNGGQASDSIASSSASSESSNVNDDMAFLEKLKVMFDLEKKTPNSNELDNSTNRVVSEQPPLSSLPENTDTVLMKMKETVLIPKTVTMLQCLYNDGLEHDAMKLFDKMRERGTVPEVVIYTSVVEELCKAQQLDEAMKVFKEMQSNNVVANAFSYGVLIQALCKGKRLKDALEFCTEMIEAGHYPDLVTFTSLLDAICAEKSIEEGEKEAMTNKLPPLQNADEISSRMNESEFIKSAAKMLHEMCRDGLVQEGMKLFYLIRESGIIPDVVTYTSLVQSFCHDQKLDDAIRIFKKMQSNGVVPNAFSYVILIQGLCKGKRLDDALEFCLQMLKTGHSPNLSTFTQLVDGFCREKGLESAQMMIKNLKDKGFCFNEKTVRRFLDKKGPFSPLVWRAIFTMKTTS
ncbi:hypothetical protein L1887_01910 [Cichorium endivia]|nr:hypothetical protein L1887_01910 [Cichorium endivia]